MRLGRSTKRANSTSLPPYDRPPTTGGVGLMLHESTVVNAPATGGGVTGQFGRNTGCRVGSHVMPAVGTVQSGCPTCSPRVKNTSCSRISAADRATARSATPASVAASFAWL